MNIDVDQSGAQFATGGDSRPGQARTSGRTGIRTGAKASRRTGVASSPASRNGRRDCRYIVLNKPYGVLSQFTDADGHPGLSGFGLPPGVYPAGRLDRDSEGLLLLTDDGALIERLLSPVNAHPRTYWVQVEGIPDSAALSRLETGVEIKGRLTKPCRATALDGPGALWPRDPPIRYRKSVADSWIAVTLTEGRNRQVRRMTAGVGHPTLRLVRVALAGLKLGLDHTPGGDRRLEPDLLPGQWREVDRREIGLDRGRG